MSSWLKIEDISKSYGTVQALKGISFKSDKGGIIGLIGPNGAGKTTLFRILLGLIKSDSGTCRMMNYDVWRKTAYLKSELGVLLERPSYPANLTIRKYLEYVMRLYGLTLADSECDEWSHKFNLPFDRILSDLSAGMHRKVGLLVAIIANPKIVLLDEPTINVDPIGREEIMGLIVDIHKKKHTKFIISSHLLIDIEKITDEVIILVNGLIIDSGNTTRLLSNYGNLIPTIQ